MADRGAPRPGAPRRYLAGRVTDRIMRSRAYASGMTASQASLRDLAGRRLVDAVIVGSKALTIAFGLDALLNADSKRFRGKAMRPRAIGYTGALFIVPLIWRVIPERGSYPRGLDLAVTAPLLLDAGGNAFGVYDTKHVDDLVHTLNSAIVASVAGTLVAPHVDEPWHAALIGGAVAVVGETAWETLEYTAFRLGQTGMNLSYADTMDDIYVTWIGAAIGMLYIVATVPRARDRRRRVRLPFRPGA